MIPLRHKLIEAMHMRGFAVRTYKSYLSALTHLTRYHQPLTGRSHGR
jgi:hypothetical protein